MASLFSAGDEAEVIAVYRKLLAVRIYKRAESVGDISMETAVQALKEAELTPADVEGIYYLTALAGADERMVVPPVFARTSHRDGSRYAGRFRKHADLAFLIWPNTGVVKLTIYSLIRRYS